MSGQAGVVTVVLNWRRPDETEFYVRSVLAGDYPGNRVLVIDNEPEIVAASLALLAAMGHEGLGAADGAEAFALVDQAEAVLVDFHLADGEDGLRLISALRRRRPGLPAALVTAERDSRVAARARRMKVTLLAKPVAAEVIEAFLAGAGAG